MTRQLENNRLIVSKAPSMVPGGNAIRVVDSQNTAWYREYCSRHTAGRSKPRQRQKHDTLIKRRETLKALHAISQGVDPGGVDADRLLPFILEWTIKFYKEHKQEKQIADLIKLAQQPRQDDAPIPW